MTLNKDQKRIIRAPMKKTGESYTAARQALSEKQSVPIVEEGSPQPKYAAPSRDWPKLAGQTDEVLLEKTGRTWAQWVAELDSESAQRLKHPQIVKRILATYDEVSHWWAQTITVGSEKSTVAVQHT